jgi:hypothetical protein
VGDRPELRAGLLLVRVPLGARCWPDKRPRSPTWARAEAGPRLVIAPDLTDVPSGQCKAEKANR